MFGMLLPCVLLFSLGTTHGHAGPPAPTITTPPLWTRDEVLAAEATIRIQIGGVSGTAVITFYEISAPSDSNPQDPAAASNPSLQDTSATTGATTATFSNDTARVTLPTIPTFNLPSSVTDPRVTLPAVPTFHLGSTTGGGSNDTTRLSPPTIPAFDPSSTADGVSSQASGSTLAAMPNGSADCVSPLPTNATFNFPSFPPTAKLSTTPLRRTPDTVSDAGFLPKPTFLALTSLFFAIVPLL